MSEEFGANNKVFTREKYEAAKKAWAEEMLAQENQPPAPNRGWKLFTGSLLFWVSVAGILFGGSTRRGTFFDFATLGLGLWAGYQLGLANGAWRGRHNGGTGIEGAILGSLLLSLIMYLAIKFLEHPTLVIALVAFVSLIVWHRGRRSSEKPISSQKSVGQ